VKFTKILFAISDLFARIACGLCVLGAVFFAFFGLTFARMMHSGLDPGGVVIGTVTLLVAAAGFWLLLRRKGIGLALVLAPTILQIWHGRLLFALGFATTFVFVFGLPLGLALIESRRHQGPSGVA
jgi:hypothetical protein